MKIVPFLLIAATAFAGCNNHPATITTAGMSLDSTLTAMDVTHHWLPYKQVDDWKTGDIVVGVESPVTWCSSFVSAVCSHYHIKLPSPDHHDNLLANIQAEWLLHKGHHAGWIIIHSPDRAQNRANEGQLVLAVYGNPDLDKPGHIAVLRPSIKPADLIATEGPQIVQVGMENVNSTSVKEGFKHHPGAWKSSHSYKLVFFAHPIKKRDYSNAEADTGESVK